MGLFHRPTSILAHYLKLRAYYLRQILIYRISVLHTGGLQFQNGTVPIRMPNGFNAHFFFTYCMQVKQEIIFRNLFEAPSVTVRHNQKSRQQTILLLSAFSVENIDSTHFLQEQLCQV